MANFILIGPQNVGKSTTSQWIARAPRDHTKHRIGDCHLN